MACFLIQPTEKCKLLFCVLFWEARFSVGMDGGHCTSYLLLHNIRSKRAPWNSIYYLPLSLRYGLDEFLFQGFLQRRSPLLARPGILRVDQLGKDPLPSSHGCCIFQFFEGFWTEGLHASLLWRLPSAPYYLGLPNLATCFSKASKRDGLL